jgi:hypothetical protein
MTIGATESIRVKLVLKPCIVNKNQPIFNIIRWVDAWWDKYCWDMGAVVYLLESRKNNVKVA